MTKEQVLQRGFGSDERPITKVLWDRDPSMQNSVIAEAGNHEPKRETVDYSRYYDPAYAKVEFEKIWSKSWIYAAREEDLPNIGDRVPFQIGSRSLLIIRSGQNEFKAFYNSCIHRGMQLCHKAESGGKIVCPFHAWEWKVDGSISYVPSHWDFRHVNKANGALREVKIGRWGGFIFINCDPEAAEFEDALGVMPQHFLEFEPEKRYTAAHFRRLIRANWKVTQEAFLEAYHVVGTHPEAMPFSGDSQSQYDVWETDFSNVGRLVTPAAVPSMLAPADASQLEAAYASAQIIGSWHYPGAPMPEFDPHRDLRAQLSDWHRVLFKEKYGRPSKVPDAVLIDSTLYHFYPNMTLWLSEFIPFAYQFLPHETDPEMSYFDVRLLLPISENETSPAPSPRIDIGPNENVADKAPAFQFLAQVFDQDMYNLPFTQNGIRSADPERSFAVLGRYQESIIQHWNDLHDRFMAS
jgi:phenylpropionate dioxygenase-like ring-hydroxylating dioxygenase large terminal subunit